MTADDTLLPTIAAGDVIRLSGIFRDGTYARVRERVSRGLVVDVTGILLLVCGHERREDAQVWDAESVEPWKVPSPRRPRGARC